MGSLYYCWKYPYFFAFLFTLFRKDRDSRTMPMTNTTVSKTANTLTMMLIRFLVTVVIAHVKIRFGKNTIKDGKYHDENAAWPGF